MKSLSKAKNKLISLHKFISITDCQPKNKDKFELYSKKSFDLSFEFGLDLI